MLKNCSDQGIQTSQRPSALWEALTCPWSTLVHGGGGREEEGWGGVEGGGGSFPSQPRVLTLLCDLIPQKAGPWAELLRLGTKLSLSGLGNCSLKFHVAKSCFCKRNPQPASVTGSSPSAGCECCVKHDRSPLPETRLLGYINLLGALTSHSLGGTEGHRRFSPCSDKVKQLCSEILWKEPWKGVVHGPQTR